MHKHETLGRALRAWCETDESYALLPEGTWLAGGCVPLALALRDAGSGLLVGIFAEGADVADHVGVRVDGVVFDALGAHPADRWVEDWTKYEGLGAIFYSVRPAHDPSTWPDHPTPEAVRAIRKALEKNVMPKKNPSPPVRQSPKVPPERRHWYPTELPPSMSSDVYRLAPDAYSRLRPEEAAAHSWARAEVLPRDVVVPNTRAWTADDEERVADILATWEEYGDGLEGAAEALGLFPVLVLNKRSRGHLGGQAGPSGQGSYVLIDGFHRISAWERLGGKNTPLPVVVGTPIRRARQNPLMLDGLDDPFEPAFHKAASKARRKALCYHGTSTTFFWNIVEVGFSYSAERKAWDNTSPGVFVAFNESATAIYASRAVQRFGGHPICFVLEVPIKLLGVDVDDRETHDKDRNWQGMVEGPLPASCITGVLLPAQNGVDWEPREVPIKAFIASAKRGAYKHLGIEPKKTTVKVGAATAIDPEHAVLDYLVDVLNYTSLTDWLLQPKWGKLARIVLENILSGRLPNWRMMDARQWLAAVEKMTGEKNEEPYFESAVEETAWMRRPFYEVAGRFSSSTAGVDEMRGLKRRPR